MEPLDSQITMSSNDQYLGQPKAMSTTETIETLEPVAQKPPAQPAPASKTMLSYFTKLTSKPVEVEEANPRKLAPALNRQHVEKFQNTRLEQFDAELYSLNNNDCNVINGLNGCRIAETEERDESVCIQVNGNKRLKCDAIESAATTSNYIKDIQTRRHIPFKVRRKQRGPLRARLLQYHEDVRPPYWGTWQRRTKLITGRRPFAQDDEVFDYEVDSEAEWDLGGPGESLKGDDSEEEEELDDYEIDMKTFVPHGYVSDDEVDGNGSDQEETPSSANQSMEEICDGDEEDNSSSIQIIGEKGFKPVNEVKAQLHEVSKQAIANKPPAQQAAPLGPVTKSTKQDIKPISLGIFYEDREPAILSESKIQFLKAFQGCSC